MDFKESNTSEPPILQWFKANKFTIYTKNNQKKYLFSNIDSIEIKQTYKTKISDIKIITDMISSYNYDSMTILQSFNFEDLEEVRRLNKRIGVGWLTVNINGTEQYDYFDRLQKLKYADVLLRADRVRQYPGLVKLIYDAGLGCVAWTPISVDEIEQTFLGGVFRIMPDIPYDNGFAKGLQNVNY
jgi:hypothetical protein